MGLVALGLLLAHGLLQSTNEGQEQVPEEPAVT